MIVSANDPHRQRVERLERDFDQDMDRSKRELHWTPVRRSDSLSTPTEYLDNIRTKLKDGYNQLMQVGENDH